MMVGNPSEWANNFTSIDERLMARIVALWPQCLAVLPVNPEEDKITINLRSLLVKDAEARRIFYYLEYQFEPEGFTADGLAYSKGQIDLAVLLNQGCTHYLAYECKRLNVPRSGARQSLATRYVNEGIKRFITEQYAEGLPIGCMLGYVLDGEIPFAVSSVHSAIDTNKGGIGLSTGPDKMPPLGIAERFSTDHVRPGSGSAIHVRHSLLPFPKAIGKGKSAEKADVVSLS
ncbi:MAG: hypothetical protein JNL77_08670 [Nitrosomonas sp.]|nr:hypothetical protein [Nitrosomonas sp.]